MDKIDKEKVVDMLNDIGKLLELKGENPFKPRAYYNAARVLEATSETLDELMQTGKLCELEGIGEGICKKIQILYNTGNLPYYDELRSEFPTGLADLLHIPSVGPKTVMKLYKELGITNIGELEYAINENRLLTLSGFGKKTQDKILEGIETVKKYKGSFLYSVAMADVQAVFDNLKKNKDIIRLSLAGSIRRCKEIVKDVDIVVSSDVPEEVIDYFVKSPGTSTIIAKGDTKATIQLRTGLEVDILVVNDTQFPNALHHFTGSKEHNVALRGLAKKQGIKINEYGLFKGEKLIPCKKEADIYKTFKMDYIEPELRENTGELEAALKGELPKLIVFDDICGVFHVHTDWSDGKNTIEEMAEAAKKSGLKYIGISDHSPTASYANGLSEERFKEQHKIIDKYNKSHKDFKIFKGVECDILQDGSLDLEDSELKMFDFVVGSIHTHFNLNEKAQTERIIKAMHNSYLTMLGHASGRLLLAREPYPHNIYEIIREAASTNTVIEINANPFRLDLDWRYCKFAKEQGVKLCINPDAHNINGFKDVTYGVNIARKGWLSKDDVINTLCTSDMQKFLTKK